MDLLTLTGPLLLFLIWISYTKGEIRCYCNAPSCVQTGYMCKSQEGRCYSLLTYEGDSANSAHGCVDLLQMQDRDLCSGRGDIIKARNGQEEWPILMCCQDDMCNYMDNVDSVDMEIKAENRTQKVIQEDAESKVHFINHDAPIHHEEYSSEKELWFKAAVIAVPIAGGFILILLVLLAVRMLRQDSKRHHRLMQMRTHRSLTKAQLYVTDHFYLDKNEKCSHLKGISNCAAEKNYIAKGKHKDDPVTACPKLPDQKAKDGSNGCSYTRDSVLIWGGTKSETIIKDSSVV